MIWLIVIISAYFLFALTSLIDKFILAGPPNPKIYVFWVGVLGILVLLLTPFVDFFLPNFLTIILSFVAGFLVIFSLFALYNALELFEASRVIPAIGGLTPLFTFLLVYFFPGGEALFNSKVLISFLFLLLGSVLITFKTKKAFFSKSFKICSITALLFSLAFFLAKQVYLSLPFWNGFIWIRMGAFLTALGFVFTKEVKRELFRGQFTFKKKTGALFLFNQGLGAGGAILQNLAIALAGLSFLPIINALQGTEYVFLFGFTALLSFKFPRVLKEEFSKKVIAQKMIAIFLIGIGLILLNL